MYMFRGVYKFSLSESAPTRQLVGELFQENISAMVVYSRQHVMLGEESYEHVLSTSAYEVYLYIYVILF